MQRKAHLLFFHAPRRVRGEFERVLPLIYRVKLTQLAGLGRAHILVWFEWDKNWAKNMGVLRHMKSESKIDWTVPRPNKNPKTKQPYKRGRNWGIVVYPENWKDIIRQEPIAVSPLHDKDVNPDGEKKKSHYHLVLNYKGNKSFEQIDEIAGSLRAPAPQRISSLTGAVKFMKLFIIKANSKKRINL